MQIKYFQDTDTLYLIFNDNYIFQTKDWDENTIIDLDKNGNLVSLTIEHAKQKTDIGTFSYQQISPSFSTPVLTEDKDKRIF